MATKFSIFRISDRLCLTRESTRLSLWIQFQRHSQARFAERPQGKACSWSCHLGSIWKFNEEAQPRCEYGGPIHFAFCTQWCPTKQERESVRHRVIVFIMLFYSFAWNPKLQMKHSASMEYISVIVKASGTSLNHCLTRKKLIQVVWAGIWKTIERPTYYCIMIRKDFHFILFYSQMNA